MVTIVTDIERRGWGGFIRKTYGNETIYFAGFDFEVAQDRADLFDALWTALDGFKIIDDPSTIPTKVACAGKAAIATYLFCVHPTSCGDIADTLGVTKSTVKQYHADVKAGRRL